MEQNEYLMKISMIQQEAEKLQEKLGMIEQQIQEMTGIQAGIEELKTKKVGEEMLSSMGKGIFIKTELKDKNFIINAGNGVMIKKTAEQTCNILKDQIKKLAEGKEEIGRRMFELESGMQYIISEAQKEHSHEKCSCENEECECEEPCDNCSCEHEHEKKGKK